MRTIKTSAVLAAAFVGLLAGSASAEDTVVVKVPFPFVVHGEQFAAGRYEIRGDGDGVLAIRSMDKGAAIFTLSSPANGSDPAGDRPALVFTREENQYELSQVWDTRSDGRALEMPSGHHKAGQAEAQPATSDAQTVVLAVETIHE